MRRWQPPRCWRWSSPTSRGLGGDLFALIVSDDAAPIGLNASGRAPADPGDLLPAEFGPTSVTVPGCVSGWAELAGRYARLGLGAAVEPAVELAQRGFTVAPRNLEIWMSDWGDLEGAAAAQFAARDPFHESRGCREPARCRRRVVLLRPLR